MNILDLSFDSEADAAYVKLAEGEIAGSSEIGPGLIVDRDGDDIRSASKS